MSEPTPFGFPPLETTTCGLCFQVKCECSKEEATLEHKIPVVKGGSNRNDNLALAHEKCNTEHGSNLPK